MQTKTILLVEDDFLNRRLSKKTLSENGYQILEAKNTREAFEILKKEKVDLAILDINLGEDEQDGISLGQELQTRYTIPFLYLTAYDNTEIATKAVATAPCAYITKPFKNIDLLTATMLAIRQFADQQPRKPWVLVKDEKYNVELPIEEIDYIESEGNYILFYTSDSVYKSRSTVKQILELLPATMFIQTHRAFVVNKTKIDKYNFKELIIRGKMIPVSKNYLNDMSAIYK
ncbi:response regulator transcription factor [Dyadobacter sp. LHD-138]|uniref:LytR/AlgR family response regulator transcription factor n=1 Tax=Dyadobacter sp. LHD-138 TaxID=3071413 RepID=UPI0027E1B5CF|nr:response regulator transcription factor [Dyadobacter sp. LHD-138]MDQ6477176.1 response regulator transcription factor [Dyadobacter sp. LHD-138]